MSQESAEAMRTAILNTTRQHAELARSVARDTNSHYYEGQATALEALCAQISALPAPGTAQPAGKKDGAA